MVTKMINEKQLPELNALRFANRLLKEQANHIKSLEYMMASNHYEGEIMEFVKMLGRSALKRSALVQKKLAEADGKYRVDAACLEIMGDD